MQWKIRAKLRRLSPNFVAPTLFRVKNAHGAAWCGEEPEFEAVQDDESIQVPQSIQQKKSVLFIHGVDYHSLREVWSDMILPFEEAAGLCRHQNSETNYVFLKWQSNLFPKELHPTFKDKLLTILGLVACGAKVWSYFLRGIEQRANQTARIIAPQIKSWLANQGSTPTTVITHSFGGYLWASILRLLYSNSELQHALPSWLNLQPAIAKNAFCPSGEFHFIPKLFQKSPTECNHPHIPHIIWYSRFDFVLSLLFYFAKPGFAMGQVGSPNSQLFQRDISLLAGEVHGTNKLISRAHLFQRTRALVQLDCQTLGLI